MVTRDEVRAAFETATKWAAEQDARRAGRWPRTRDGKQPHPPWPDPDDPALDFVLKRAQHRIEQQEDPESVLLDLAITAWFEGHIEGYDRAYNEVIGRRGQSS